MESKKKTDMSVAIAGVTFRNPVMTASGTFGSGMEYADFVDLNRLGAVVTKGVSNVPWEGNPTPRVTEVPGGMLNAIGLQNPGVDVFIERDLRFLEQFSTKVIVNVCGHTVEEYLDVVERLADEKRVDMLEINVSCPNVKQGAIAFGTRADALFDITQKVKKAARQPIIMKLTPNVTSIAEMAKAAEAGGADAISLINTITGMKIDVEKQKLRGLSRGEDPDHRHGRHLLLAGCGRAYARRCHRGGSRRDELPRSVSDGEGGRRPGGLCFAPRPGQHFTAHRCGAVRGRR